MNNKVCALILSISLSMGSLPALSLNTGSIQIPSTFTENQVRALSAGALVASSALAYALYSKYRPTTHNKRRAAQIAAVAAALISAGLVYKYLPCEEVIKVASEGAKKIAKEGTDAGAKALESVTKVELPSVVIPGVEAQPVDSKAVSSLETMVDKDAARGEEILQKGQELINKALENCAQ